MSVKINPVTGNPASESKTDPTHQVRLGAEYLFISTKHVIPLRGGIFYDPAPAEGSPDKFHGFSLESGINLGPIILDIAYQYRFGNDTGQYMLKALDFSQDIREHTVYSSVIVHL